MSNGESQPKEESGPQSETATSGQEQTGLKPDSRYYDAIISRYGEAMLRIGQLESQLDGHGSRREDEDALVDGNSEAPRRRHSPDYRGLLKRIEALERPMGTSTGDDPGRESVGLGDEHQTNDTSPPRKRRDEAAYLRLQIAGLNTKLTQTELELRELKATRSRRRSRSDREPDNPKWKFWQP